MEQQREQVLHLYSEVPRRATALAQTLIRPELVRITVDPVALYLALVLVGHFAERNWTAGLQLVLFLPVAMQSVDTFLPGAVLGPILLLG